MSSTPVGRHNTRIASPRDLTPTGAIQQTAATETITQRRQTMSGEKVSATFEVQEDALAMLDEAVEKHDLDSRDKALRCLLDYCAEDGDWEEIFEVMRCRRC